MAEFIPYQFEPLASADANIGIDWESEEESENEHGSEAHVADDASSFCKCGKCDVWQGQKEEEKRCCHFYQEVMAHLQDGQSCITDHEGVFVNCLSRYSIDSTIVLLKQKLRDYYRNEVKRQQSHATYRHVAYCNFVRWIWRTTGRKNRKILPACLVAAIRSKFPSEQYAGFKYAV